MQFSYGLLTKDTGCAVFIGRLHPRIYSKRCPALLIHCTAAWSS